MTGRNKLKAAIYGFAVADALGVPVEFKRRGTFLVADMFGYGTHNQPAGTWSDDTSMTLATCDSIKAMGTVDCTDMLERFRRWIREGEYTADGRVFDYGMTTANALATGRPETGINSNGNGSLMRVLPLAFLPEVTTGQIEKVSEITHGHKISKDGCVLYVEIARRLIGGEDMHSILETIAANEPYDRLPYIAELDEDDIRSSGFVVDTLEAALWSVATTESYRDAVLKAVNLGDDTDTVGAVSGGLAGIIYGLEGIPTEWIDGLRNKAAIDDCLFN